MNEEDHASGSSKSFLHNEHNSLGNAGHSIAIDLLVFSCVTLKGIAWRHTVDFLFIHFFSDQRLITI